MCMCLYRSQGVQEWVDWWQGVCYFLVTYPDPLLAAFFLVPCGEEEVGVCVNFAHY